MNNLRRILNSKHQNKNKLLIFANNFHQLYPWNQPARCLKKWYTKYYICFPSIKFRRFRCLVLGRWSLLGFQRSSWAPLLCLRGSLRCNRWSLQCLPQDGPPLKTEELTTWVVVSNIFYFHPCLGKISYLTTICQSCWNHQLATN